MVLVRTLYLQTKIKIGKAAPSRARVLRFNILTTRFIFYKNKPYKNTQADFCPKIKNKLRTITRLKFDQKNLRNLFNPCTQIEMYMKSKPVRI